MGIWRTSQGSSVLLETRAPARSIICVPATSNDCYGEQEYLVNRRFLCSVKVIDRFSQVTPWSPSTRPAAELGNMRELDTIRRKP